MDGGAILNVDKQLQRLASDPVWRALSRGTSRPRHVAVAALGLVLAVSTAATLVACAFVLIIPGQLDEGEPLIYGLAMRLLDHQPLYQPIDRQPFVQVHYTPLYYAAVAVLREFAGPGFVPGRVLSILSGLGAAGVIGYLTAARAKSWWAGAFAIVLYLGLGFPGVPAPFLALERVDMLGTVLSVAAIGLLTLRTNRPHLVVAGVLAGLALLTKQSLFAAALAGTIWLVTVDWRKASVFALTTAVTALVPAFALEWSSAGAFWHNVGPDNPSATALASGAYLFRELVVMQGVPLVLAGVYVISSRAWRDPAARLLVLYWLATMISVVGIIKVGANHNYWIELAGADAVLAALCIWSCLRADRRGVWAIASIAPIGLLGVQLGALGPDRFIADRPVDVVPIGWTLNIGEFAALAKGGPPFVEFVEKLRDERGPVLGEAVDAVVLSDHAVQLEPFAFSMLEHDGRWNSQPLVGDICLGRINLLVLSYPITSVSYPIGLADFPMWPNSVMQALRRSMTLDRVEANHWLYRPTRASDPATIALCQVAAAHPRVLATPSGSESVYQLDPFPGQASLQDRGHLELPTQIARGLPASAVLSFSNGEHPPLSLNLPIALTSIAPDADRAEIGMHLAGAVVLDATSLIPLADLPTSAQPTGLRASVVGIDLPPIIPAASSLEINVVARNVGRSVWLAHTGDGRGAIGVAVRKWIGLDGKSVQVNGDTLSTIAGHLDWNVNPGLAATFTINAIAPPVPGHYDLVLDMLSENVTWFEDVGGGARTLVPVDVAP